MEIKRDYYLDKLIKHRHNGFIKIVSGVRRCGKSYLLFELFKQYLSDSGVPDDHIITIALDDRKYKDHRNPDTCYNYVESRIKDDKMYYLLLDEVQMMDDFESVLNGFLHIKNLDVYVTGSNSKFLSTDVVTEFRGRGDEIRIYPLNFAEYYEALNCDWNKAWDSYCTYGGMPALFKFDSDIDKKEYLKRLFKETYIRDVVERNKIQNETEFEELLDVIASNIGCLTNPKKLADTFNSVQKSSISEPTIKQYLSYLAEAFLVNKVLRYDIKGKKYLNTPFKYYFIDPGLRNSRLNFRQIEPTHLMENIIYNELIIRGYQVDVGNIELREKKGNNQYIKKQAEVDFVLNQGSKRYYIQAAYEMPDALKKQQEEKSLINIPDSFKKIIIVSGDIIPKHDENGITIIGLKDFLLNPHCLEL
ncbi:MAG: ATP-binding protein [Alphaproteobacteria bacterium]|nr:ATP-binding protein [Alphaproteobacteria bacterium]